MKRAVRMAAVAGIVVLASLWTLTAAGAWWLLQAGATALEAQPTSVSLQAVMAWTERPWVRHWLEPHEIDALRDGFDWLQGLGGGPGAWLGSALTLLGIALFLVWAGGLLLGVASLLAAWLVARRAFAWWQHRARGPWAMQPGDPASGDVRPAG